MAYKSLALLLLSSASAAEEHAVANPIRKVVTMLQAMQKKIVDEADKEEALYQKFECYCKGGDKDLAKSIAASEAKVPAVSSSIEEAESQATQMKADLKQHQVDRDDAKAAMKSATALREKDAAAFAAEKAEAEGNIAMVKAAVSAIEKGMGGSFVQTAQSQNLQRLVISRQDLLDADRQQVLAFLSQSSGAPQSGEIVGILKEMGSNMEKSLADATASETEAIKTYEGLMAAQSKQVASLTGSIEEKTQRAGELAVSAVQMKNDLSDAQQALVEDKKYLAELDKTCASKASEWEERKKTRTEELAALAETITLLNDDDALELFKKTLPSASASFVQLRTNQDAARQSAMAALRGQKSANLDFVLLSLRGQKNGFEKVIAMIDNMVGTIEKEQKGDEHQKEFCNSQIDTHEDSIKELDHEVATSKAAAEDAKEGIAAASDAIAALTAGIKALDKSVAEAGEQRQAEHTEYKQLLSSDSAAKQLLGLAKNRLNKFYNKALYKAAPKRELSEEDRIVVNNGGTLAPTAAPGGIAGTGITAFADISEHVQMKDAPAPPPETFGAYSKKSGEANGVVAMIDLLIKDLDKELTEAATEEKDAQADYEALLEDSAAKRAEDSKALSDKASAKAELEGDLQRHSDDAAAGSKELMATSQVLASVHAECDWLLTHFSTRADARKAEISNLQNAKSILSGADYSF